jgi:nicotinate-nucleotide adenylyltransferase
MARAARSQFALDEVIWMIASLSPLKRGPHASGADRLAMVRLAIEGEAGFAEGDDELARPGPSYTIDTIRDLKRRRKDISVFLVLGSDSLATFPRWREAAAILQEAQPVVAPRRGFARSEVEAALAPLGSQAVEAFRRGWLEMPEVDIASTDIRRRVRAGASIHGLVPDAVERHIRERGLYRDPDAA